MLDFIYKDDSLIVAIKPPRVLSTDEPGGMPELVRLALADASADVRTVHRLDRVVSGLMVLARGKATASALSLQVRSGGFRKTYLAVVHGKTEPSATLRDLLLRNKAERKTYVTDTPAKGVQEAVLDYVTLAQQDDASLVRIELQTGRTHQIRAQFSSRELPLYGDRKYSLTDDDCEIALWSHSLTFTHPVSGKELQFSALPPQVFPWTLFAPSDFL